MITMTENSGNGAKSEDRIAALEKKVNAIDALVKGLTQELLDLKPLLMKTSKVTIVKGVQVLSADPVCGTTPQQQGSSTVIVTRRTHVEDTEPQAAAEPGMDMILQSDGTKKLEPRRGDKNCIISSTRDSTPGGYGRNKKRISVNPKQSKLTAEEDKTNRI